MEAMALESLVSNVWRFEGFLTITRYPLQVYGGYSDVDAIGVRSDGVVRIGECKARGGPRDVYVETDGPQWTAWWDNSFANIPRLWEQRPPWLPLASQVNCLEYHLFGNVWFANLKTRSESEARLAAAIDAILPPDLKGKLRAIVTPSIDLLFDAVRRVREDVVGQEWGKRYGDSLLDALRELIRYAYPKPSGGGQVGATIRDEVRRNLLRAVFGEDKPPSKRFHE